MKKLRWPALILSETILLFATALASEKFLFEFLLLSQVSILLAGLSYLYRGETVFTLPPKPRAALFSVLGILVLVGGALFRGQAGPIHLQTDWRASTALLVGGYSDLIVLISLALTGFLCVAATLLGKRRS